MPGSSCLWIPDTVPLVTLREGLDLVKGAASRLKSNTACGRSPGPVWLEDVWAEAGSQTSKGGGVLLVTVRLLNPGILLPGQSSRTGFRPGPGV